jgi:hypothetical protein
MKTHGSHKKFFTFRGKSQIQEIWGPYEIIFLCPARATGKFISSVRTFPRPLSLQVFFLSACYQLAAGLLFSSCGQQQNSNKAASQ